jgi:hypothetical protein
VGVVEFALKLPLGLSLNILGNWDGQALRYFLLFLLLKLCIAFSALPLTRSFPSTNRTTHSLRYVLRDRKTDALLFVVSFNLIPVEHADENEAPKKVEEKKDEKVENTAEKHEDWEDDLD